MTEKSSVGNLNCENCNVNKNMLSRYGINCEICGNVDPKTINKTGCASHPMALQVLAAPVIEELEKDEKDQIFIYEHATTMNEEVYHQGIVFGIQMVIRLLNEGIKK